MEAKRKRLDFEHEYPKFDPRMMFNYLTDPKAYDCKIIFNYPKAIQRAYRDEKRFVLNI